MSYQFLIRFFNHLIKTLPSWEKNFFCGDRLLAEVVLFSDSFRGRINTSELSSSLSVLRRSYGLKAAVEPDNTFIAHQRSASLIQDNSSCDWRCLIPVSNIPDALILFMLIKLKRNVRDFKQSFINRALFSRFLFILIQQYPHRRDLLFAMLLCKGTGVESTSYSGPMLCPGSWYSAGDAYTHQLQIAWVQGNYQDMWFAILSAQLDRRYFPLTDHHIRGFSIIGEAERALSLFMTLYNLKPSEFKIPSLSNMLFMSLGSETFPLSFIRQIADHFCKLSLEQFRGDVALAPTRTGDPRIMSVNEKPLLVVVSSDLRQHPVGRFWLPIARQLRSKFRVISVAGHPNYLDPIRTEIQECSDEWWPLLASELVDMSRRIRDTSPSLMLDLGGHTADNFPQLLTQRLATVQATYLGFYGPTYARCCDWWILDKVLMSVVGNSYPGAEPIWPLPCPSLCYEPSLHDLPDPLLINYQESELSVFGSFNHTRKLSRLTQKRFASILTSNSNSILYFRSHSFRDSSIRRRFMMNFIDMGISPHQLNPIPFASTPSEAMADYGRIHVHLDSTPISGTTTTLDSLAMGIPVLTSPTPYYAGAISSAILNHAGLGDHVCDDPQYLSDHALWLASRYRSAQSRRNLAQLVRQSPICDTDSTPKMFVEQLGLMLRQKQAA